jgi:hypothetical protein
MRRLILFGLVELMILAFVLGCASAVSAKRKLTITTNALPVASVSVPYSFQLQAAGGTGPQTWSITQGSLPTGIVLTPLGLLSGTPTEKGQFIFTIQVVDSSASASLQIQINLRG